MITCLLFFNLLRWFAVSSGAILTIKGREETSVLFLEVEESHSKNPIQHFVSIVFETRHISARYSINIAPT
ncbi:hypothetical protein DFS34DRAFT_348871 [Phlyctochytrium arcticum]|nr:hypothetical protein DFS34DRAFT_348871 [Phlyctochytrium arcticum]